MADHGQGLSLAEVVRGTAQDFAALQVMGHAAIPQVDAVVVEQAVLTWHLEVVSSGHDRSIQINDKTTLVDVVDFCASIAFLNH